MALESFLKKLKECPEKVEFNDTMDIVDSLYVFTPSAFKNGNLFNEAGQNSGSCKVFSFGRLHDLTPEQTLACFGSYYRNDVLKHPDNSDHQNIRNFMKTGWSEVHFDSKPLHAKSEKNK
ncbi:metal-dependent Rnase [Candidatus Scalindua japonica]|uniref:Metal-dependent Rnase n=1 Tax=Candidatus Scalindua japonica TaxID=1284222 RepID=A0A286TUL3_9BACT|nr:HopJ type III effector protein [Candidatus Scalindua japonica]GAX59566.1 metal-dependent Rnase [Candidatus Scalindua japonica]